MKISFKLLITLPLYFTLSTHANSINNYLSSETIMTDMIIEKREINNTIANKKTQSIKNIEKDTEVLTLDTYVVLEHIMNIDYNTISRDRITNLPSNVIKDLKSHSKRKVIELALENNQLTMVNLASKTLNNLLVTANYEGKRYKLFTLSKLPKTAKVILDLPWNDGKQKIFKSTEHKEELNFSKIDMKNITFDVIL